MKISTKELSLQSILKPMIFEKEFEFDESIPDHLPNIKDALFVSSDIISEKIIYDGDKIGLEYTLKFKLYYISEQGEGLCVHSFTKNAVQKTDLKKKEGTSYLINSFISPPQIRTLNPRKIFTRSTIFIELTAIENGRYSILSENQDACFTKTRAITASMLSDLITEDFSVDEEIILGDGYDPIGHILDTNATLSHYECEFIPSYCILKGTVALSILYSSEVDPERIIHLERQVSFEKNIPTEHSGDGMMCICKMNIAEKESSPSIDSYGEYRLIKQKLDIEANVFGLFEEYDSVVTDIFTVGKSEKTATTQIKHTHTKIQQEKDVSFEGIISTGDITFSRIISSNAKFHLTPQEKEGRLQGEIYFDIIGETPNGIRHFSSSKEFEHEVEATPFFARIEEPEWNMIIAGGNSLSFKTRFKISSLAAIDDIVDMINSVEFSEISDRTEHMIIYYPQENEMLWDIAKKYHISPDVIKSTNPIFKGDRTDEKEIVIIKYN